MKGRKSRVAAFLAIISVVGFLATFGFLAVKGVPEANKDYIDMCLIALIGFTGTAMGYYLGGADNQLPAPVPPSEIPLSIIEGDQKQ